MAIKPSGVCAEPGSRRATFDEAALIDGVYNNDYILVAGSGVMLDRDKFPEADGDINTLLLQTISVERGKNFRSLAEVKADLKPQEISPVYDILVNRNEYDIDEICPELRRLLETYLFRFVFTTTPDSYMELLMRRLWGDSLLVVNLSDERSLTAFCNALVEARATGYCRPTLFYVFGKAIRGNVNPTRFLESDEDAILYVERWMKLDKDKAPIVDFLRGKKLLGLGCRYEDWYFRFFWYILKRQFGSGAVSGNHFGPTLSDNVVMDAAEPSLREYLDSINVCVHDDPWQFMSRIHDILTSTAPSSPYAGIVREKMLGRQIFLSYKMDPDHAAASELFRRLVSAAPFRIWFDQSRLLGGDRYNPEIKAAIAGSKVFIPVLTRTVAEVIRSIDVNATEVPYFVQEWRMAREVPGIRIIPVAFDGYNLRGPEHQIFESIILKDPDDAPSGIDLGDAGDMPQTEFGKLVKSVYTQLGIDYE